MKPEKGEAEEERGDGISRGAGGASWRGRRLWALGGLALAVLLLLPVVLRIRSGVFGEYVTRYAPNPQWDGLPFPAVLAGLMVVVAAAGIARGPELEAASTGARWVGLLLSVLVALKFLLHLSAVMFLGEFSLAEAVWPFVNPLGDGAYHLEASQVDDSGRLLRVYQQQFLDAPRRPQVPHVETHPPGPILFFVALHRILETFPACREGLEKEAVRASPILEATLARAAPQWENLRYPLATSLAAALFCFLLASLVPVGVYLLAREGAGRQASFAVATVSALFPGSFGYSPGLDQALAVPALVLVLLGWRALRTGSIRYGLLFGLASAAALFFTLGFLVPAGMVFWAGVAAWRSARGRVGPAAGPGPLGPKPLGPPLAGALAGFLLPVLLLHATSEFNLVSVLAACQRNNASFLQTHGVNYWPWVATNLVEAAYSMGMPAAGAIAVLGFSQVRRALAERSLAVDTPIFWGVFFTFLLLWALGINRAEVARIWLFLFPILAAATARAAETWLPGTGTRTDTRRERLGIWVGLLTVQAAHVLLIRASVDALETGKFFYSVMRKFSE
ncbi:MAG: hypothetical protein HYU36_10270 [Planctomycetes bacterium]|nr:hypothetical protein [Planctomycetota bacterium]